MSSLFSLRYKHNRIVLYWVAVFVMFGLPSLYFRWPFAVGVLAGMLSKPLYDWKTRGK